MKDVKKRGEDVAREGRSKVEGEMGERSEQGREFTEEQRSEGTRRAEEEAAQAKKRTKI